MTRRDLQDYGFDVVTPFGPKTFARSKTIEVYTGDNHDVVHTDLTHWTMYDYFRAIALLSRSPWDEREGYCHIIGVREMSTNYDRVPRVQGVFNDLIAVIKEGTAPELYTYEATIDPGGVRADDPRGQAILASGSYSATYIEKYTSTRPFLNGKSLVRVENERVFRDKNMDGIPDDPSTTQSTDGILIHFSSSTASHVDTFSTGCTAIHSSQSGTEYQEFISLMRAHSKSFSTSLVYTVASTNDFRTPKEIFNQPKFYNLLSSIARTSSSL